MRYSQTVLWLLAAVCLFNFQCEEDCFEQYSVPLSIDLQNYQAAYGIGDTLWFAAEFPATQNDAGQEFTISETGGLVSTYLFSLDPASEDLTDGSGALHYTVQRGLALDLPVGSREPYARYLQYDCDAQTCGFRFGIVTEQTGTYLLQMDGLGVDVAGFITGCPSANVVHGPTELSSEDSNLTSENIGEQFTLFRFTQQDLPRVVDTENAQNLFLIKVQ